MDAPAVETTFVPLFEDPPAQAAVASTHVPADDDFFLSSIEAEKQRAFEAGRAEGEREALRAMSEQLDAQVARWNQTLARLQQEVSGALDRLSELLEERTVTIGVEVARRLLEAELRADPAHVARRVRAALDRYRHEPVVTVRVHPDDLVFVQRLRSGASPEDGAQATPPADGAQATPPADAPSPRMPRDVEYVADPAVPRGGFIVDTALARYDHTFQAELEQMSRALTDLYEDDADGQR